MTPWERLEIPQTADKKKIKRAYAKKLKTIDIDRQPEEFQLLKEAFDFAMKWTEETVEDQVIHSFNEEIQRDELMPDREGATLASFNEKQIQFLASAHYHYDLLQWQLLLQEMDTWSIEEYMRYSYQTQCWLVSHYQVISREIIHFLFEAFSLKDLEETVGYSGYTSEEFVKLRQDIYTVPPFSFTIAEKIDEKNREQYFTLRYSVYSYLKDNYTDRLVIENMIAQAKAITLKDLDLDNLEMLNFIRMYGIQLNSGYIEKLVTEFLAKADDLEKNQTYELLSAYFEVSKNGASKVPKIFTTCPESELTIPHYLYNLMTGNMYFVVKRYDLAYLFWRNLPSPQQRGLIAPFEMILGSLPRKQKKECRDKIARIKQLKKETDRRKKIVKKTAISNSDWLMYGFILLGIVLAILLYTTNSEDQTETEETMVEQSIADMSAVDTHSFQWMSVDEEPIEKAFIMSIYLASSNEERKKYAETLDELYLENELLPKKLMEYEPLDKFSGATIADFSLRKNALRTNTIIYYKNEPISIITFSSGKIYNVLGEAGYVLDKKLMLNTEFDDLDLPLSTYAEKFIYTLYVSDNELIRYLFDRSYGASDSFEKQLQTFKKGEQFNQCSMNDFSFIDLSGSEIQEDTAIYFKGERMIRMEAYSQNSLESIIGDQWNSIYEYSSEPFTLYKPEESLRIFLKQILFSTDKEQHLASYHEYFSESLSKTIEKNFQRSIPKIDDYSGLFKTNDVTKESKAEDVQIILENAEYSLLFAFTNEGKLDHVYGQEWEPTDQNLKKLSQTDTFSFWDSLDDFINE